LTGRWALWISVCGQCNPSFFLVADTAQGVEHVVVLGNRECCVFLLDEVLDESVVVPS